MKREVVVLWIAVFIFIGAFFQNCSKGSFEVDVPSAGQASSISGTSGFQIQKPICLFNGKQLNEGTSVTAYQNSTPEFTNNSCISETRTCKNGILSGSMAFAICKAGPKSCLFNGITVLSGDKVKAYNPISVSNCLSEDRLCTDGALAGSYRNTSCVPKCIFNGSEINPGTTFTYYSEASGSCLAKTGTCSATAQLLGDQKQVLDTNATFDSCSVSKPPCNFKGHMIPSGSKFAYYTSMGAKPKDTWMNCSFEAADGYAPPCSLAGARKRYGVIGLRVIAQGGGPFECHPGTFGQDPAVGSAKTCEVDIGSDIACTAKEGYCDTNLVLRDSTTDGQLDKLGIEIYDSCSSTPLNSVQHDLLGANGLGYLISTYGDLQHSTPTELCQRFFQTNLGSNGDVTCGTAENTDAVYISNGVSTKIPIDQTPAGSGLCYRTYIKSISCYH